MPTVCVSSESVLNNELQKFIPLLGTSILDDVGSIVGLEIRLSETGKVPILALCTGDRCVIIQLLMFQSILVSLFNFLAHPSPTFVGVRIKENVARLHRDFGLECRNAIDLSNLAASALQKPQLIGAGLAHIADVVLVGCGPFRCSWTMSSWSDMTLSQDQKSEIERSVRLSFDVGNKLFGGRYYVTRF